MFVRNLARNLLSGFFLASLVACGTDPTPNAIAPNSLRQSQVASSTSASGQSSSDRSKLLYRGDPKDISTYDMALALARYNLPAAAVTSPSPTPTPVQSSSPSPSTSPSPLLAVVRGTENRTSSLAEAAANLLGQPIDDLDSPPSDRDMDFAAPSQAIDLADVAVIAAGSQLPESDRTPTRLRNFANNLFGSNRIAERDVLSIPGAPSPPPSPRSTVPSTPTPPPPPRNTPSPRPTPTQRATSSPTIAPIPNPPPTPISTFTPAPLPTSNPFPLPPIPPGPAPLPTINPLPPAPPQICSQQAGPFITQSTASQRSREAQFQGYEVSGIFPCLNGYCFNLFFPCSGGSNPPPGGGFPPGPGDYWAPNRNTPHPCDNPLVPTSLC